MNTFSKVWAVKVGHQVAPGTVVPVSLKRGTVKDIAVGPFLYAKGDYFYYAALPQENDDDDAPVTRRAERQVYQHRIDQ